MKKHFLILALALATTAQALQAENIPIDEAHFPDAVFRNYVLNEMTYHKSDGSSALVGVDGQLSDYERKRVVTICFPDGCKSAEGVQYFAKSETGRLGLNVYVKSDDLKTLDLSGMDVTKVKAGGHKLESLNLKGCTKLTEVECPMNALTTLNVEGCTELETLKCYDNKITALNLAQSLKLLYLECHKNQLTELNINSPALEYINCGDNPLQMLFLPNIDKGTSMDLYCANTQIPTLDLRDNKYTYVDCSGSPITGIEWSSAGNGYVIRLQCNNTHIIPDDILAIPNPEKVQELKCDGCGLTSLDLSRLTNLTSVNCQNNLLTTLDVSHNTKLRSCYVNQNQLFALDVSGTTCSSLGTCWQFLQGQTVEMNGKTWVKLNNEVNVDFISDLQVWHNSVPGTTKITTPTMQGDYLLVDETGAGNVSKVWYIYHVGNGLSMHVEITTGDYGVAINEYNFPDQKLRDYLLSKDYGADALLTEDEIAAITELDAQNRNIASLEGIQYLRNLTYLNVSGNHLTDEGFSDLMAYLPNLTELYFDDNESITRFDAFANTKLRTLSGWGCALTTLDVRGLTELEELYCDDNRLTFLNLTENPMLRRLQCNGNQFTEIYGLDSLINLRSLDVSGNQLSTLDVSNFPLLYDLYCGDNNLTTLDLTQNTNLRYLYVEKNQLTSLLLPENAPLKWLRIYGNQLKQDVMRTIVELLPPLATTYNVRAYYEGLGTEGNELTPALVSAMRAKNWNPQYTTNGTTWQDYAGGTASFSLWLRGNQVTTANAANLTALAGVSGSASFDELTNTLTLNGATITGNNISNAIGLRSQIDGLTIRLEGNNTINVSGYAALQLDKNTTITGTGKLTAQSDINGIYIYGDTLTVSGGATVNVFNTGSAGYGIYGRTISDGNVATYYGTLAVEGDQTKVQALGPVASVGRLKALVMPTGTTLTVTNTSTMAVENGYFYENNVCTRTGLRPRDYVYTTATGMVSITTPREGLAIDETNFPDEAFRSYLLAQSYGTDAILTDDELENISTLTLNDLGISDLTGISHFFALENLYASGNQLTTLDLEGLTMLENVEVMDNQLDSDGITTLINSLPEGDGTNAVLIYHEGSSREGNVQPTSVEIVAANQKGWQLIYQKADGSYSPFEPYIKGDVNGDGSVTIADVTALVNIILGKSPVPASGIADVNDDGSVTIADVTGLVNIILGKS